MRPQAQRVGHAPSPAPSEHDVRSEHGGAVVSTALTVAMFVFTVGLGAHMLVTQYGRWAAQAALRDAVHDVASLASAEVAVGPSDGMGSTSAQALADAERRIVSQLGAIGSEWRFEWSLVDGTWTLVGQGPIPGVLGSQHMRFAAHATGEPTFAPATAPTAP